LIICIDGSNLLTIYLIFRGDIISCPQDRKHGEARSQKR
jgi:hypothetical protein